MREKWYSQRETVFSLPKRETHGETVILDRYVDLKHNAFKTNRLQMWTTWSHELFPFENKFILFYHGPITIGQWFFETTSMVYFELIYSEVVGQPRPIILKTRTLKLYILTLFVVIFLNYRDNFENKVARAIWHNLKRVLTSENILKTNSLKHAFWQYFKRLGTVEKKNESNVSKACILTVFQTTWNCRAHSENNGL